MTFNFADTCFWIALANPRDNLHAHAVTLSKTHSRLITTHEVLGEFLNYFCGKGKELRHMACEMIKRIELNPNIQIIKQTPESFAKGFDLYRNRLDKEYSLPDCISMVTMSERKITQVLTHDHHFTQEGFTILMND